MDGDYFQAAEVPSTKSVVGTDRKHEGYHLKFGHSGDPRSRAPPSRTARKDSSDGPKGPFWKSIDLRQPNPFEVGERRVGSFGGGHGEEEAAWGLKDAVGVAVDAGQSPETARRADDVHEVSSGNESHALLAQEGRSRIGTIKSSSQPPKSAKTTKVVKKFQAGTTPQQMEEADSDLQQAAPRLTHLTSSGEAHMVDVGAKQATRRDAVAGAYVRFSNPAPFQLIFENSNKKGDVLGVARIAGIMAAKRTADLVPLCHPVPITKVEVGVKLVPSGQMPKTLGHRGHNYHGLVIVETVVETLGPTGVEMEALTATFGAALTVYDMCKAVDRMASVEDVKVVYKSGGRSGVHVEAPWAHVKGKEWFASRDLTLPRKVDNGMGSD